MSVSQAKKGSPLDQRIVVTTFETKAASKKSEMFLSLRNLAQKIAMRNASSKEQLPWLKLARFGDMRTEKNSLRHDANVLAISGIEVDYDGEVMTVNEAVDRLTQAGIASMVYTSPSHADDAPRWRILCPLSTEMPSSRREQLVGRLNGLFSGLLAGESFALSQSYYFGSVNLNPSHRVELIDGSPIDEHDDLDEIWIGRPHTKQPSASNPTKSGSASVGDLVAAIMSSKEYHQSIVRLAGVFARGNLQYFEARAKIIEAMESVPEDRRDRRWQSRRGDVDRILDDIYLREAVKKDDREAEWQPPDSDPDDPGPTPDAYGDALPQQSPVSLEPKPLQRIGVVNDLWEEESMEIRPWIARGYLMRGALTVVSGQGSAGKSSLMVAWSACISMGNAFGQLRVSESLKVCVYNVEDDENEQKRRFSGFAQKLGVHVAKFFPNLAIITPKGVATLVETTPDGRHLVSTEVMNELTSFIEEFRPDVLMLDPFVELHGAEENDNTAVRAVMAFLRHTAVEYDMSVVVLHHSRKGEAVPGDPDSLRGASAIVGAARVVLTLNVMSEVEADALSIPKTERRGYFRLDGAKSNYAQIEEAEWFQRQERRLANGDDVVVAWPWKPPSVFRDLPSDLVNAILDRIAAGYSDGVLYRPSQIGGASPRWCGNVILQMSDLNAEQAKRIVKTWLTSGLLVETIFIDPAEGKKRPGVMVDNSKRP